MHRRTLLTAALALAGRRLRAQPGHNRVRTVQSRARRRTPGRSSGSATSPTSSSRRSTWARRTACSDACPAQVSLRHHGATEGLFNALSAGAEDFLVAAGSEAMQARAEGVDVIAVGAYYKAFPVSVIVLGSSEIRSLSDLKGRSLGVPGRYGESWLAAQVALNTAGLTEKDVKIVEVGYTQVAALTTKKVDAVVGFRPTS